jgi:hypothetical protein
VGGQETEAGREPDWSDDRVLLAELGRMFDRVDPAPAWLREVARGSYGLRSVDLEVAEPVADSEVGQPAFAAQGTTGPAEPRLLGFEADGLLIDLRISHGARGPQLAGQLVPASTATVELRRPDRPVRRVETDELGRFALDLLEAGPFSLLVVRPGLPPVATTWMTA